MSMHLTISLRMLKHVEALLSELDSPIAQQSCERVHRARLDIETLERIEERGLKGHAIGDRS